MPSNSLVRNFFDRPGFFCCPGSVSIYRLSLLALYAWVGWAWFIGYVLFSILTGPGLVGQTLFGLAGPGILVMRTYTSSGVVMITLTVDDLATGTYGYCHIDYCTRLGTWTQC